ncbi:DUF4382 domain-containing protein [Solimicrobium silvestre]|uniref:DUF4382 domain-containing protein n=1 Tax=Solimicrobium silvestre TaxID=2099400 RepID=A0A2S9GZR4_9BURK|nr:DUF4382 domain-containing protein [Solimicrobium silvestre]PRC93193.1 hypothetical protein S2091_1931 [Solimicrobium silvestre]
MQQKKLVQALVSIGLIGLLAACGGGGGSSGSSTGSSGTGVPTGTTGTVTMGVTDGPSDTFNHVWVTVTSISFHTSATQIWSKSDATWQTTTLPAPITIDLAALNNGALNNVFANMTLPVGTYKQIRFFFASDSDALSSSAQAISDNETTPTPLQWNDQVEYTNTRGTVSEAPLEIAYPTQGMQLLGTFNVTAGSATNLVTDFDLDKIIVPFNQDGQQAFTMRPDLRYFNLTQSGAITGTIDPTKLCQTVSTSNCAFNLIVHAETLSADGTRHVDVRSTNVDPVTGSFTLSPLSLVDSNNNPITYDIVVRGRNMETMLITGVTPTGTYTGTTVSGGAVLQSTPLEPTAATEYGTNLLTPLNPLTSGFAVFQQTLPSTAAIANPVPYEIRWSNTDPYTGVFYRAGCWNSNFMLTNGSISVAPYNAGNALVFTSVTPQEGNGGYSVATNEVVYYNLSNNLPLAAPTTGNISNFTPPTPTLDSGINPGSISGNIAISNASAYDHGTLVIARLGQIITSVDVSSLLSSGGGTFTVGNIPSGSATAAVPGAYYYSYIRLWKHNVNKHVKIVPITGSIDLRTTNSVTGMNVTVAAS